jgi:ribosomal-protein-serine acetyltransferase
MSCGSASSASAEATASVRQTERMPRFDLADGLQLRVLEESDAEELYGVVERNRAYLAEWLPWPAEQTLEGTLGFIKKTRDQLEENDGFQTAMVVDGRIVGSVGFVGIRWDARATSIGYWLAEEHQRRGLMTRAVGALTDHAFDELDLNRVEIQVASDNRRSRAIPERLGFTVEGVLRDYERVGERFLDIIVYALLARERQQ